MKVIKRNCTEVPFDKTKISTAILKAMKNGSGIVREDIAQKIACEIEQECKDRDKISISDIELMVYDKLITNNQRLTAKAYEGYRSIREFQRDNKNTTDREIEELLQGDNEYLNTENSNKNAKVLNTQRDYMAGIVSKDISRRILLPPEVVQAHDEGIIHFHDIDYFGMNAMSNCFSGDTKFITNYGVKSFDYFYDGDIVEVKDKDGIWRKATVRNYGKKKMYDITFKTPHSYKTVTCTKDHRWVLKDGTVTAELKVGDSLYTTSDTTQYEPQTFDEKRMFCFGFSIGDGNDRFNGQNQFCGIRTRLCGNKTKYKKLFLDSGYIISKNCDNGDIILCNYKEESKQNFLSYFGWRMLPLNLKIALFNGYYAADGHTNDYGIDTIDTRLVYMIDEISALAGYYIQSKKEVNRNTNYKNNSLLYCYRFSVSQPVNWAWKVVSIEPHCKNGNKEINAWCVEEPITHSFLLENGMVTGNCCLINLEDMLQNSTVVNKTMIEKPHKFLTACTIATQIILSVTSMQYGGATISLTHLAPFVRDSYNKYFAKYRAWGMEEEKAKEFARLDTEQEISDGVQTFNYQCNSMSNSNGQSPFLSVFMYLGETEEYKEELAMIIEEFLKQRIKGVKNEVGVYITQAFPKLLYVLEEDNIHRESKYWHLTELAAQCAAKRMVPDFISEKMMLKYKEGNCFPCMGCRSFLAPYKDENGKYKFYGRLNQGVVTLNLVDVALSSEGDFDKFWELMEQRTELCHKALLCRHHRLEGTLSDVAPILWQYGAFTRLQKGEKIDSLLHGGYSSISLGYAGLYECVKYMTGESHIDSSIGHDFGIEIMKFLNKKCDQWNDEHYIGFSLYGSPIENTTYKFAKCLQKRFGIIDGITDRNYITNSYHTFVKEPINAFDKLEKEAEFQVWSLGGAISYVETSDLTKNTEAVLEVMNFIYDHIIYAELNTKSDYCQVCGYDGEIKIIDEDNELIWECPNCKNRDKDKMNVTRRTCGYLGTNFWGKGRTQEINERFVHLTDLPCKECE